MTQYIVNVFEEIRHGSIDKVAEKIGPSLIYRAKGMSLEAKFFESSFIKGALQNFSFVVLSAKAEIHTESSVKKLILGSSHSS